MGGCGWSPQASKEWANKAAMSSMPKIFKRSCMPAVWLTPAMLKSSMTRTFSFCCKPKRMAHAAPAPSPVSISIHPSSNSLLVSSHVTAARSLELEAKTFALTCAFMPLLNDPKVSTSMLGGLTSLGKTCESGNHPVIGKPCKISLTKRLSG